MDRDDDRMRELHEKREKDIRKKRRKRDGERSIITIDRKGRWIALIKKRKKKKTDEETTE